MFETILSPDSADHMISAVIFHFTKYITYFFSSVMFCFDLPLYLFLVIRSKNIYMYVCGYLTVPANKYRP